MARIKKLSKDAQKTLAILKAKTSSKKRAAPKRTIAPPKHVTPEPVKVSYRKSFSKAELDHFKTIILEKKKEILEELETLRDTMVDSTTGEYVSENSTYSTHMEQGTDTMEREKMFLFASREGKFLNYLEDAMKRIEKGTYGRCTVCGKLIEKERLEAVPHAQQCLDCKLHTGK